MSKIIARRDFGLPKDVWSGWRDTGDARRIALAAEAAVGQQAMVRVTGPRGAGKSMAVNQALAGSGAQAVAPLRLTREKLHLGDIEQAIIRDLSTETPRRTAEARSHQVRAVLGEASRAAPVVLVVDDSHLLHHQTLRGLKRLRELAWLGRAPLLGVLLVGQQDRAAAIPEVALRSDAVALAGLSVEEVKRIVKAELGGRVEADALGLLAKQEAARNWLDLQHILDQAVAAALAAGRKAIGLAEMQSALGQRRQAAAAAAPPATDALGSYLAGQEGRGRDAA